MTRSIFAIDQATVSGVAWADDLRISPLPLQSSIWDVSSHGTRIQRVMRLQRFLRHRFHHNAPDLVVFEEPIVGNPNSNTAWMLFGYATAIEMVCEEMKVPHLPVPGRKIKEYAHGKGNIRRARDAALTELLSKGASQSEAKKRATKHAMLMAARGRGWTCRTDDEADALFLLEWTCKEILRGELRV